MIHQFTMDGTFVVLDIFSGSVHVVDEVAYDIIGMYQTSSKEEITAFVLEKYRDRDDVNEQEIAECMEDIEALREAGKLFTEDVYETVAKQYRRNQTAIKALCLHVAHVCNLACSYCFAGQGAYKGKCGLMSLETGKKAIDFLIANSEHHKNLDIDFFGGEPLMNWEVVKELVAYGREQEKLHNKNIRFTLTTNGMLLDEEVTEFCNKEMHNVVLSLDGRKEVHNRFRVDYKNQGSYDIVVPKFQKFVNQRGDKSYYIRGTYTHHNTDFLQDIIHMADLGYSELSMEPVVCDPSDPCALTDQVMAVMKQQYEDLAREKIKRNKEGNGFTFYHYMLSLTGGPCIYKRVSGCGSGTEYLAVTPEGDLYPCHQFVGNKDYCMGNLDEGVSNTELRNEFASCNVYTRPVCETCWAKLYCAGGCAANAYNATGSINGIYEYGCELFRKRIECALMVKIAEQEKTEE